MPETPTLTEFPPRPEGFDRLTFTVVADRSNELDEADEQSFLATVAGLDLSSPVLAALVAAGFDPSQVHGQCTIADSNDTESPVFILGDLVEPPA